MGYPGGGGVGAGGLSPQGHVLTDIKQRAALGDILVVLRCDCITMYGGYVLTVVSH